MRKTKAPKVLYVVLSDPGNPHADGPVLVFTTRRQAERECRWGDQRTVEYVPKTAQPGQ